MTARICRVDGCEVTPERSAGRGMCNKHYLRWRRHGDVTVVKKGGASLAGPANPNWSGDEASYNAVHLRLGRLRGPAAKHVCVDCGTGAAHWSYDNGDPNELRDPRMGRYSTNPARYEPRCVRCHKAHDSAARALLTGTRP